MHLFCPNCANLLVVEEGPSSYRFACNTCPYVQNIKNKVGINLVTTVIFMVFEISVLGFIVHISSSERGG